VSGRKHIHFKSFATTPRSRAFKARPSDETPSGWRLEEGGPAMMEKIRDLIDQHAGLPQGAAEIGDDTDLYRQGMKSFASVQLMLAIEEAFDIEFPEEMLNRATFRSAAAIARAVESLSPGSLAA
jgi:acyl carrier protein